MLRKMVNSKFVQKFKWPLTKNMESSPVGLYKYDQFMDRINSLVIKKKAYCPISGGTRRTESSAKIKQWIEEQKTHEKKIKREYYSDINTDLEIAQFPSSDTGNNTKTITTSKTQLFLIDHGTEFIEAYKSSFGKNEFLRQIIKNNAILLFEVDSLESGGRAFSGDPFTGQIAAFSKVYCYDLENNPERKFVVYYPHQLFTQFFDGSNNIKDNKGIKVISSNVDVIITNNGVILNPKDWKVQK